LQWEHSLNFKLRDLESMLSTINKRAEEH